MPNKNKQPYRIVNLEQGTEAWLNWRDQGLGASDAPTIMGENRWKSRAKLLHDKKNQIRTPVNAAMARGTNLEPEARSRYEERTGIKVFPTCLESTTFGWLRASVDGLSQDGRSVVEIKCGEGTYKKSAASGRIPEHYVGQLQHILAVTGLEVIDFWCYLPGRDDVHIPVERDEDYIQNLLIAEEEFWEELRG